MSIDFEAAMQVDIEVSDKASLPLWDPRGTEEMGQEGRIQSVEEFGVVKADGRAVTLRSGGSLEFELSPESRLDWLSFGDATKGTRMCPSVEVRSNTLPPDRVGKAVVGSVD